MPDATNPEADAVLIVDDDEWAARLVTALLRKAGYRATHVPSPLDVVPLLRGRKFSLILLDQNMPGMDGLTLLGEIRKESEVPVVMVTAQDRSDLAVRALRLGAFDYLTKPVEEARLLQTVQDAIASGSTDVNRIAHYQIEHEVGRGGMGVVYAAHDRRLNRKVALKVLLPELAADPGYETSFLREARTAAQFAHPNIVTLYEAGRSRGRLYMAMELVQGQTLHALMQAGSALPVRRVFEIGLQVASALEAVHSAGMIHRDLKPGNVMMTGATIKVLDFGLVRPMPTGGKDPSATTLDFSGTLAYAAPELLNSGKSDVRGDVYALGVLLYELLSGVRAFHGETQFVLMTRVVAGQIAKPWSALSGVSPEGVALVQKLMALDPLERVPSMTAAASALATLPEMS